MNDNADLFNIKQPQPDPQQGGLLISEPFLDEIYFQRACVLLVDYLPDFPTTGLVLNKRINLNLNDVIPELKIDKKIPLYCGGPLSLDRLFSYITFRKSPNRIRLQKIYSSTVILMLL